MEDTPGPSPDKVRTPPKSSKWSWRLVIFVFGLFFLFVVYNMGTNVLVIRADFSADRDPETGILRGAEELLLGPEESPKAALLVHGFLGGSSNFGELPSALAERGWRVHAMRLPGHGTSPRDFERAPVDTLITAVQKELAKLSQRHDTVLVVGHSMGGALSTLAVAEHGADGLVLAAPYFGVTYHWYYGLKPETWSKVTQPFVRWVYKGDFFMQVNRKEAKSEIVSYTWTPTRALVTLRDIGHRAGDPGVIEAIACPVLHIHSSGDVAASYSAAANAVAGMTQARAETLTLKRSNHHVFWDYERDEVVTAILEFAETVSPLAD
jgi:carboxylesterase